uniref:Uncharacterized protein n=1 Tax=Oryza punctata TaxID=4537 RepID=A0A0E0LFB7_ORYPU
MPIEIDLLVESGWGLARLVPYHSGFVEWSDYKKYLADYFTHNKPQLPPAGQQQIVVIPCPCMLQPTWYCIEMEDVLIEDCIDDLSRDDVTLVFAIKARAEEMIQSEDAKSSVAVVALECIAKEAALISKLLDCNFNSTDLIALSNNIRRSALNLMLYQGPESPVTAGAMLGITTEAERLVDLLSQTDTDVYSEYLRCKKIRECTSIVLLKLEQEFASKAADVAAASNNTSEGVSDVSNFEVSDSMKAADVAAASNNTSEGVSDVLNFEVSDSMKAPDVAAASNNTSEIDVLNFEVYDSMRGSSKGMNDNSGNLKLKFNNQVEGKSKKEKRKLKKQNKARVVA